MRPQADLSNDAVIYSIYGDDNGNFFVSPDGMLKLARPLDRETVSTYEITMVARGNAHPFPSVRAVITVLVEDVPDNIPQFQESEHTFSIAESSQPDHVITTLSATTPDSFPVSYSIVGGRGQDSFSIDATTGVVTLSRALRYNTRISHQVIVRASNGPHPLTSEVTLVINVQDQQLPLVFIEPVYHLRVPDSVSIGQLLGYVLATDGDQQCGIPLEDSGLVFSTDSVCHLRVKDSLLTILY